MTEAELFEFAVKRMASMPLSSTEVEEYIYKKEEPLRIRQRQESYLSEAKDERRFSESIASKDYFD